MSDPKKRKRALSERATSTHLSRRAVLKGGAAGAAAVGLVHAIPAAAAPNQNPAKNYFLLDRITFGYDEIHSSSTPNQTSMFQEISSRGYMGFLDWQLGLTSTIDDSARQAQIAVDQPRASLIWGLDPWGIISSGPPNGCGGGVFDVSGDTAMGASIEAILLNGYRSRKQLQIVMAVFWSTVHSTFLVQTNQFAAWMPFFKRALYDNALGQYGWNAPTGTVEGMVPDSARGASMLLYLDQWMSDQANPIENYARELLELHTVGVKPYLGIPSYLESDVVEVAKIFTGWTMHYPAIGPQLMQFTFNGLRHTPGNKTVQVTGKSYLGNSATPAEGEQLILDLVRHPLTALHMSERLIRWFLGDGIWTSSGQPGELYNAWIRVALRFYQTQGDLQQTIRELFDDRYLYEIWSGPYRKVRRPLNLAIALMRAAGPDYSCANSAWLSGPFRNLAQVPGFWPAPNGYPSVNSSWASSMRSRVEFLHEIVHNPNLGLSISPARLLQLFPTSVPWNGLAQHANQILTGGIIPAAEVGPVQTHLNSFPNSNSTQQDFKRREAILMTLAAPSYQFLY